jgi:hypothetical protein
LAFEASRCVKPSTIGRRHAAISYAHQLAGHAPPGEDERVLATLRGIRRSHGSAPLRKAPATADMIIAMHRSVASDYPISETGHCCSSDLRARFDDLN